MGMAITAQNKPYCFISYSRQEVTFVDSFARELETRGICTWVDFRNLVPGHPWQNQLDDGVNIAKTILLVVSKASMASLPVKDEWTKSLAKSKRIILILFEPCKLDPSLTGLAWVDFTRPFDKAMRELIGLLARSTQSAPSTLPQKWLHVPASVTVFAFLSLLLVPLCALNVVFFGFLLLVIFTDQARSSPLVELFSAVIVVSLFFIWLPTMVNFAWLPIQLFRRTHNAQKIRNTLNALLYSSLLSIILYATLHFLKNTLALSNPQFFDLRSFLNTPSGPGFIMIGLLCLYLNRLLVSKAMYRWSGPNGVLVQKRPPDLKGHIDNGNHMRVAFEYAPQDRLYAQELKASIRKAGHFYTDHVHSADIVLCLLSAYKTDSAYDLERIRMIPIILQVCQVDQRLSRMQWIDLRHGKVSMDAVAHLLDEPAELMRTLGVLPVRQVILPNAVKWLSILISFFLTTLLMETLLAAFVNLPFAYDEGVIATDQELILSVGLILGLYFLRRYILNRKLRYLPFLSYWWAVAFAVLIFPWVLRSVVMFSPAGGIHDSYWWAAPLVLLPLSMLHKEVRLWLPSNVKGLKKSKVK